MGKTRGNMVTQQVHTEHCPKKQEDTW